MKLLTSILLCVFLASCAVGPAKDISGQFAAGARITSTPQKLEIPSHGKLLLKGRQGPNGKGISLLIENKDGYFGRFGSLRLTSDINCKTGYKTQFSYPANNDTILSDHWPAPILFTETVTIELRWSPTQLTAKVYDQEKTVNIRFTPRTLSLSAEGADFIINP